MQYKGFRQAMMDTRRGDVPTRPARSFTTLMRSTIPILLIWGRSDRTVPLAESDTVKAAFPRAEFRVIDDAGHLPNIEQAGNYFRMKLEELQRRYSFIREVRGKGLMIGVELAIPGKQIVLDAMEEGLLLNCTHDTVLRFLPPYIITEKEIDRGVRILNRVFKKAAKQAKAA